MLWTWCLNRSASLYVPNPAALAPFLLENCFSNSFKALLFICGSQRQERLTVLHTDLQWDAAAGVRGVIGIIQPFTRPCVVLSLYDFLSFFFETRKKILCPSFCFPCNATAQWFILSSSRNPLKNTITVVHMTHRLYFKCSKIIL